MRLRLAAIVFAAATCGLFTGPAHSAVPANAAETATDLTKYAPDGSNLYVHINVQQFLAAPVIRTAIPMAMDKYGDMLMGFAQMAKAFDPNAANVTNDQIKSVIDELKKPATIANAFDAAKDGVTDIVVAGSNEKDDMVMLIVKCHEAVNAQLIQGVLPFLNGNPQIQVKTSGEGAKTVFEVTAQNQTFYLAIPNAGIVIGSASKAQVEKGLAGKGSLNDDLKKLVAERKKTDFIFSAMAGKGKDDSGIVSGWGRLVLDKDISGQLSANYANAAKAADQAKEMNEHIGEMADKVKEAIGPAGKDIAAALEKAKAVATGTSVTSKFSLPGSVVEKLLAKDKE